MLLSLGRSEQLPPSAMADEEETASAVAAEGSADEETARARRTLTLFWRFYDCGCPCHLKIILKQKKQHLFGGNRVLHLWLGVITFDFL